MMRKNKRTIDAYMKAGASARLYKEARSKFIEDVSKVLPMKDVDRLLNMMRKIDEICTKAEDNMFRDYPNLSNEYLDVFYGGLGSEPRSGVDKKTIGLAKETAQELFEKH